MKPTILVTGATGTVGSHVVSGLANRGAAVRALVRDVRRARERLGGVAHGDLEISVGDFADAASLRHALDGAEAMFLACANDPRQFEYEAAAIDAAVAAGVRRIVKLSAIGAEAGSPVAFWDIHARAERRLRAAGVSAVVLRASFFMTNVLAAADPVRRYGRLFAPAGSARVAMIDPRDVAAAAVAALTHDRPGTGEVETHELTGPEAITYGQVAEALSEVAGRGVEFVDIPDAAAREGLAAAGMPPWLAENVVAVFGALRHGAQQRTTPAVAELTGRSPRGVAEFARDHAAFFGGIGEVAPEAAASATRGDR